MCMLSHYRGTLAYACPRHHSGAMGPWDVHAPLVGGLQSVYACLMDSTLAVRAAYKHVPALGDYIWTYQVICPHTHLDADLKRNRLWLVGSKPKPRQDPQTSHSAKSHTTRILTQ